MSNPSAYTSSNGVGGQSGGSVNGNRPTPGLSSTAFRLFAGALLCWAVPLAPAAAPPPAVLGDAGGDPLPPSAVARLGSQRFRLGRPLRAVAWSPDGRALATVAEEDGQVIFLEAASGREIARLPAFKLGPALFSPDGKRFACCGGADGGLNVWDWKAGRKLLHFRGLVLHFEGACFSPDGKRLAAHLGKKVVILDAATGSVVRTLPCAATIPNGIAYSPCGGRLAASVRAGVWVWDTGGFGEPRKFEGLDNRRLRFTPSGKELVGGDREQTAVLIDAATGERLRSFGKGDGDLALALSADGRTLATRDWARVVRVWDVRTGALRWASRPEEHSRKDLSLDLAWQGFADLALSPDGRLLAGVGPEGAVVLMDARDGRLLTPPRGGEEPVNCLCFSSGGALLAAGGRGGGVRIWEAGGWRLRARFAEGKGRVEAMAFSSRRDRLAVVRKPDEGRPAPRVYGLGTGPRECREVERGPPGDWPADERLLAVSLHNGVWLQPIPTGAGRFVDLSAGKGALLGITFAPGWRAAAARGLETVSVRDGSLGRELRALPCPGEDSFNGGQHVLCFSSDGRHLAAAGVRDYLAVWDASCDYDPLPIHAPGHNPSSAAFSPDGRLLASGGDDGTVRVWELATRRAVCVLRGHRGCVGAVAFSPDGWLLVSGATDTTALVWDWCPRLSGAGPGGIDPERLWRDLGSEDPAVGWAALRGLVDRPGLAASLIGARVRPVSRPDVAGLLAGLNADAFAHREAASATLRRLGWIARPGLERLIAAPPSLEAQRRAERLLKQLRSPLASLPADDRRADRAVAALERVGSAETRLLLRDLGSGAEGAWVTGRAREADRRLAGRGARKGPP